MNLELDGLYVLVTGGSKGIGLACVEGFLREGARCPMDTRLACGTGPVDPDALGPSGCPVVLAFGGAKGIARPAPHAGLRVERCNPNSSTA